MAVYRTTDTELTSIADAIRAKTGGSSSLVYPTGFVSAINSISTSGGSASSNNLILKDANGDTTSTSTISSDITLGTKSITPTSSAQIITPETGLDGYHTVNVGAMPAYNFMGENLILVQNLYNQEISLDDTSFSSWTPSTSTGTILATSSLSPIYLPVQYDYIIKVTGYVKYVYEGEVPSAAITEYFMSGFQPFGQRPNVLSSFINSTYDYVTYGPTFQNLIIIFHNSSGTPSISGNNYGIMINMTSPGTSSPGSTTDFGMTPRTPQIRAVANSGYMSTAAFSELDTTNTKIYMKMDLYRCESRNDAWHNTMQEMIDMYNTLHPIT